MENGDPEERNGCLDVRPSASPQQPLGPPLSPCARGAIAISPRSQDNAFFVTTWSNFDLSMASRPSAAPTGHAAVSPEMKKPHMISVGGFRIATQKLPILKAEPIEEMTKKLGVAPPEMIFGDNHVAIEHEKTGWGIDFNAFDALDRVDKTGQSMLQVAYSKEWQQSR